MTDTATEPETSKKSGQTTEYVILKRERQVGDTIPVTSDGGVWWKAASIDAHSSEAAIRTHGEEGEFVAIPARSWKPVTVAAETKTVLKLT